MASILRIFNVVSHIISVISIYMRISPMYQCTLDFSLYGDTIHFRKTWHNIETAHLLKIETILDYFIAHVYYRSKLRSVLRNYLYALGISTIGYVLSDEFVSPMMNWEYFYQGGKLNTILSISVYESYCCREYGGLIE